MGKIVSLWRGNDLIGYIKAVSNEGIFCVVSDRTKAYVYDSQQVLDSELKRFGTIFSIQSFVIEDP